MLRIRLALLVFVIVTQICEGYVIIDPVTGREVDVDQGLTNAVEGNNVSPRENIAIRPGDFVRGRTSNIKLKYLPTYNNNG